MNYIKHLSGFFERVAADDRLNPTHISIYVALFQIWNINRFQNPISISRSEMMRISKISAKATYHKVIKQLHEYGYIQYQPSYNPFKGSAVYLVNFCTSGEQAVNMEHTKNRTSTSQAVVPYINSINNTNNKLGGEHSHGDTCSIDDMGIVDQDATEKQPKKNSDRVSDVQGIPGTLEDVKKFFRALNGSDHEAEKFFNYYQSNGWKVGGRTPMRDWTAGARKWMLNELKFSQQSRQSSLHISIDKNYGEPL
jgi:hypothetical protein